MIFKPISVLSFEDIISSCTTKLWIIYIIIEMLFVILLCVGVHMSDENNWSTLSIVSFSMLSLVSISHIWSRYVQRKIFLQKQTEKSHFPYKEDCSTSLLLAWFCSPCIVGQMNSALKKHKLRHLV